MGHSQENDDVVAAHKKLSENGWGYNFSLPVAYHDDGPIGTAVKQMGADALRDFDGKPLGDVLGELATHVVVGRLTAADGLAEYKKVRDRLTEGRARRALDWALADMEAPDTPAPELPATAPEPLHRLAAALHNIPLVRRDPRELEDLIKLADHPPGPMLVDKIRRTISNKRHESLSDSGKLEIDRAVQAAAEALEKENAQYSMLRREDPAPFPTAEELAAQGVRRNDYVLARSAWLDELKEDQAAQRITSREATQLASRTIPYLLLRDALVRRTPSDLPRFQTGRGVEVSFDSSAGEAFEWMDGHRRILQPGGAAAIAAQLLHMQKDAQDNSGTTTSGEQAADLLSRLSAKELREVATDVGIQLSYLQRNKAEMAAHIVRTTVGNVLNSQALVDAAPSSQLDAYAAIGEKFRADRAAEQIRSYLEDSGRGETQARRLLDGMSHDDLSEVAGALCVSGAYRMTDQQLAEAIVLYATRRRREVPEMLLRTDDSPEGVAAYLRQLALKIKQAEDHGVDSDAALRRLEGLKKPELEAIAEALGISGAARMTAEELRQKIDSFTVGGALAQRGLRPSRLPANLAQDNAVGAAVVPQQREPSQVDARQSAAADIQTVGQAAAFAETLMRDATTDLEDSVATVVRATRDEAASRGVDTSLRTLKMPKPATAVAVRLMEVERRRLELARQMRAANAERADLAQNLREQMNLHVALGEKSRDVGGVAAPSAYNGE